MKLWRVIVIWIPQTTIHLIHNSLTMEALRMIGKLQFVHPKKSTSSSHPHK